MACCSENLVADANCSAHERLDSRPKILAKPLELGTFLLDALQVALHLAQFLGWRRLGLIVGDEGAGSVQEWAGRLTAALFVILLVVRVVVPPADGSRKSSKRSKHVFALKKDM